MATLVFNHNNYKSCPLKKRPIFFVEEEDVDSRQERVLELTNSSRPHAEEAPQDLSLKRKASQDFEDHSLPAKRDYVLNLSVNARANIRSPPEENIHQVVNHSGATDLSSSGLPSPSTEYDSKMDYTATAAIHLRGLTSATSGYTTDPYQSAFVMAAGCNPITALWNAHPSHNISSIFPSPASSIVSSAASPRSVYSSGCNSAQMMMTPPSSPGSEASESSEPEDLSVRNDIPLPALFHFFDEAPTSALPVFHSSSSASHFGSTYGSSSSSSSSSLCASNVAKNYRFKCDKCNKMYSTSIGLSKHLQFHCPSAECNQEKKQHACEECGKLYTTIGALKMHIRTHTLPCKCPICGKAFSRPWLLQGHIRTHTGEKPFQCSDCPRSFADRSNLRAHQQTHFEVKKYVCKVCNKSFSRMSLLNKHASSSCSITIV